MISSLNCHSNLNQNILRQIIFTNKNLLIGASIGLNLILFLVFKDYSVDLRVFIHFSATLALVILATIKIDGIYLPFLFPKIIAHIFKDKRITNI